VQCATEVVGVRR